MPWRRNIVCIVMQRLRFPKRRVFFNVVRGKRIGIVENEDSVMKTALMTACVLAMAIVPAFAVDSTYCPPVGCPQPPQTVSVQVPVTEYVDEPYTVNVTRMVPVEQVVEVPQGRWVTERRQVPATRTEYVNEPYTVNVTRYETRRETRTRQVNRTVRDYETRQVNRRVYERVCDPVTGRSRRVARDVCDTVTVPVKRRVCVDEPYTVNVRYPVSVPVTRTRRVVRQVPTTREVCERRWVTNTVRQTVTTMQPVVETQTAVRRRAVVTNRIVERPVETTDLACL